MNLLYIEDDPIDQLTFQKVLSKVENVTTTICSNIEEATAALNRQDFDLVFVDYYIDDNNIEAVVNIIEPIPFVILSGLSILKERGNLEEKGMINALVKPITYEKVLVIMGVEDNKQISLKIKEKPSTKYLKGLSNGDVDFERELLNIAIEELPSNIASIQKAYDTNNSKDVLEMLHKVRTKVTLASMNQLSEKIASIESKEVFSKEDIMDVLKNLEEILIYFKKILIERVEG